MVDPVAMSAAVAGLVSVVTTLLTKSKCVMECNDTPCCEGCSPCCEWCRIGFLDVPLNQHRSADREEYRTP
jgi:hypothetical protein